MIRSHPPRWSSIAIPIVDGLISRIAARRPSWALQAKRSSGSSAAKPASASAPRSPLRLQATGCDTATRMFIQDNLARGGVSERAGRAVEVLRADLSHMRKPDVGLRARAASGLRRRADPPASLGEHPDALSGPVDGLQEQPQHLTGPGYRWGLGRRFGHDGALDLGISYRQFPWLAPSLNSWARGGSTSACASGILRGRYRP